MNASNEQFMNLFENSPVSLWLEDFSAVKSYLDEVREKGYDDLRSYFEKYPEEVATCAALLRIIDLNKSTLELYKAGSKEELMSGLDNIFTKESFDVFREGLIAIAEGKSKFEQESVTQTLTGERRDVIIKWSVIPGSKKSSSTMVVSIVDLTGHKRAAETIELLSRRNEMILKSAGDGICGVDLDGVITFANPAAARMTGWNVDELIGKSQHEVLHHTLWDSTPHPREDCRISASMKDGVVHRVTDEVFWRKDGTSFPVEYVSTPIRERDKIVGAVVVFNNISERKQIEEALKAATIRAKELKARTEAIIAAIGDNVSIHDADFRIIYQNQTAKDSSGDRIGEHCYKAYHNRDAVCEDCHLVEIFKDGKIRKVEKNISTANGEIYLEITSSPLKDAEGKIIAGVELFRDIAARKESEKALRLSEEKYRLLVEAANSVILSWDPAGNILFLNDYAERFFGFRKDELIGRNVVGTIVPRTESSGRDLSRLMEQIQKDPDAFKDNENENITKDGRRVWVRWANKAIVDERSTFTGILSIGNDITDRKRAEEILQQQRAQLDEAQRIAHVGSWERDVISNRVIWSDEFYRMIGFKPREIEPSYDALLHMIHSDDLEGFIKAGKEAVCERKPYTIDYRILRRDGTTAVIHASGEVVYDQSGNPTLFRGTAQDITERKQAEEALRERDERLRQAVRVSQIGIFDHDQRTDTIYWSPQQRTIYGWGPDEPVTLQVCLDFVHPEDIESVVASVRRAHDPAGDGIWDVEHRIIRHDGAIRWLKERSQTFFEGEGDARRPVRTVGAVLDITERKQAERLLNESEQKYKNLVELTSDIIYLSDKTGNQTYMNDAAYKVLGYTPEEVIQRPWINLIHPDDREITFKIFSEMLERKTDMFNFENRYLTKTGRAINMLHNVRVLRDEQGEIIGTQGIARDITGRKDVEENLKLFSKAIDEATDGVLIVDLDGYIVYSNKASENMFGYAPGGMTSKHVDELNAEQDYSRRVIIPSIKETGHWNGEVLNVRKDGGVFPVWLSTSLVKNDKGGPFAMVGIIRDITERKRVEEELFKSHEELEVLVRERTAELRMLNDQLRDLSVYLQEAREQERTTIAREIHDELGQSLTALKMDLSILNKRLPKDQLTILEKTESMAELIEATIQSVKRISTELRPGVLDHLGLTAAIEWQAGEFEKRTGVLCDVAFEPEELELDRHRSTTIFRIFQETLTNITRHAEATNVSVRLKKLNNKLVFEVKDDGKGITEKQLSDTKSLGLIGIRERVHYWGGSLTIRGSRNKGTTVAVRIPLDDRGEAL